MTLNVPRFGLWTGSSVQRLSAFYSAANRIGGQGDGPANFGSGETGCQLQRLSEEAIAEQNRDFVAPIRRQREPATANLGLIHHIIVHQRR